MLALSGCGGCGGTTRKAVPHPAPRNSIADEAVVRLWSLALYEGRYARAASFFAPRAIVQQGDTRVLRTRREAIAFNRSLTCRATVLTIRHEKEGVLLATFTLAPGPAGGCTSGGRVRVRFGIRRGLIEGWHQLPDAPALPAQSM
jgi:hypothetical protein